MTIRLFSAVIATVLFPMPVFAQSSGPYFGKSDAPVEDVTMIKPRPAERRNRSILPPSAAEVEATTRNLIQEQLSTKNESGSSPPVRLNPAEQQTRRIGNKWSSTYNLSIGNIPLSVASSVSGLTLDDGSATVIRELNTPRSLNFEPSLGAQPTITVASAERAAHHDLKQLAKTNSGADIEGLVLKKSQLEIWVDPKTRVGKLAWALDMSRDSGKGTASAAYKVWVDALAKTEPAGVFEVKNLIFKERFGVVRAPVWDPTPNDPFQLRPLPKARVQAVAASELMSENPSRPRIDTTDDNGIFAIPAEEQKKFTISLENQYFTVRNAQGAAATISGVTPSSTAPLNLQFSATNELEIAQPSAFYWANRVRGFASDILKETDLLNMELLVNMEPDCNAYYDSSRNRIELLRGSQPGSGKSCINKAYRDTIFHEFGHAIDHAYGGIATTPEGRAYSEGFGDSITILFKNDSCYGANHEGPRTCLRDANTPKIMFNTPNLMYHERGRIYSGFTWELLQALKTKMPEAQAVATAKALTFGSAAQNPVNIENAVELVLLADDDDLDLSNGTPNSAAIKTAANARGIPLPRQLP